MNAEPAPVRPDSFTRAALSAVRNAVFERLDEQPALDGEAAYPPYPADGDPD